MSYDDLMREANRMVHASLKRRDGKDMGYLSEAEARQYTALHIQIGKDIALESEKDVLFLQIETGGALGFVEICNSDPSVNGILFIRRHKDRYAAYAWGGFPQPVAWAEFHRSIVEVWAELPDEYKTARPGDQGGTPGH